MGDHLGSGYDADVIPFQDRLVMCRVIAIAGEAVELPDDDNVELLFILILDKKI